ARGAPRDSAHAAREAGRPGPPAPAGAARHSVADAAEVHPRRAGRGLLPPVRNRVLAGACPEWYWDRARTDSGSDFETAAGAAAAPPGGRGRPALPAPAGRFAAAGPAAAKLERIGSPHQPPAASGATGDGRSGVREVTGDPF